MATRDNIPRSHVVLERAFYVKIFIKGLSSGDLVGSYTIITLRHAHNKWFLQLSKCLYRGLRQK